MRKRRFLLIALGVLLLCLFGGLVWLGNTDLGRFRPHIEAALARATGRAVFFDEALSIRLGREVRIQARGLRIANPDWASRSNLLEVDQLDVSIILKSLWRGPVVVTSLEGTGIQAWPERSADGASNLALVPDEPRQDKRLVPVLFRQVKLQDVRVGVLAPERETPLEIYVASLVQQMLPDGMLDLQTHGTINGQAANFQGTLGTFTALLRGQDVRFGGKGQLGPLSVAGHGRIDDLLKPRFPELELTLSGNDFEPIARVLNRPSPGPGSFSLSATAQPEGGMLHLRLEGTIGALSLTAAGSSNSLTDFSVANYAVTAQGPDLGSFAMFLGLGTWPRQPFTFEGGLARDGALFRIDDLRLDVGSTHFAVHAELPAFPAWRGGEGRLDISGPDVAAFRALLGFDGPAQGDFEVHLALKQGEDGSDRLQGNVRTSLVQLSLDGRVGAGPQLQGSQLQATLEGPDAGVLLRGYGLPGFAGEAFTLKAIAEITDKAVRFAPGSTLTLDDDHLEVIGEVGLKPMDGSTDFRFKVSGGDLSQFAPLLQEMPMLPGQPYVLEGGLRLASDAVRLDRVKGSIGPNQIDVDGKVSLAQRLRGTELQVHARGPSLQTLVADTVAFDTPAGEFDFSGRIRYLATDLLVDRFEAKVGALTAQASVSLRLPLRESSGRFDIQVRGPDAGELWPASLSFQPAGSPFELALKGDAADGVWTFEEARLILGDARFTLAGALDDFPDFSATQLVIRGDAPDIAKLGTLRGNPLRPGSLALAARFTGTKNRFRLDELRLQLRDSDLQGWMVADFASSPPSVEWYSRSQHLDLARSIATGSGKQRPAGGASAGNDGLPFADWHFPMAWLARFNARLDIGVDSLRLPRRAHTYTKVALDAEVRDGGLRVSKMRGEGLQGFVESSFSLLPRPDGAADLAVNATAKGLVLNLSRDLLADPTQLPVIEYAASVTGHGRSLHEALASLNGSLSATASPGVVPNSALQVLEAGLIEQVLNTVLPGSIGEPTTNVECLAIRLEARDGMVQTAPILALVTDKVQMISGGTVNLANGALDLTFENYPNKAYKTNVSELLVNPFVKISGTLAEPKMVLDAPRALLYSSIAVGTGGLSILAKGLLDRVRRDSNPCEKFIEQARGD